MPSRRCPCRHRPPIHPALPRRGVPAISSPGDLVQILPGSPPAAGGRSIPARPGQAWTWAMPAASSTTAARTARCCVTRRGYYGTTTAIASRADPGTLRAMSIFLVGGGPDTVTTPVIFDRFTEEARAQAAAGGSEIPRIAVVLVDNEGSSAYFLPAYVQPIEARTACEVNVVLLRPGGAADPAVFNGVDAIVVGAAPPRSTSPVWRTPRKPSGGPSRPARRILVSPQAP